MGAEVVSRQTLEGLACAERGERERDTFRFDSEREGKERSVTHDARRDSHSMIMLFFFHLGADSSLGRQQAP